VRSVVTRSCRILEFVHGIASLGGPEDLDCEPRRAVQYIIQRLDPWTIGVPLGSHSITDLIG
jgi:hypothetical protein